MAVHQVARYHDRRRDQVWYADTCTPLEHAAASGQVALHAWARGSYPGRRLPSRALPGLCTVGYWDAPRQQTWGLGWHRNEGLEITFLDRGSVHFDVDNSAWRLRRGNLTITRPWQRHRVGDPNVPASRLGWLILDVSIRRPSDAWRWPDWLLLSRLDLEQLTKRLSHNEQPVWPSDQALTRAFRQLMATIGDPALNAAQTGPPETRLRLHINEILVALLDMLARQPMHLDQALCSAQRSVELFLEQLPGQCDEPWTVEAMAEQCGLGTSRFTFYCRELLNCPPMVHLARVRVQRAAALLRETDDPVTQIALRCGFASSQYFATVFRQHMGVAPRAWRLAADRTIDTHTADTGNG